MGCNCYIPGLSWSGCAFQVTCSATKNVRRAALKNHHGNADSRNINSAQHRANLDLWTRDLKYFASWHGSRICDSAFQRELQRKNKLQHPGGRPCLVKSFIDSHFAAPLNCQSCLYPANSLREYGRLTCRARLRRLRRESFDSYCYSCPSDRSR